MKMREFTWRALLLGLVMTAVLGAANAYLGLRAGQTIAATYPAAVIGMAVLRLGKGTILEENIARTAGSIGESVAAGAVFTLPAFYLAHVWTPPVIPKNLGFLARLGPGRRSQLSEIHRPDDCRLGPGRALRFAHPPRDGGRSRTALPRIPGRF